MIPSVLEKACATGRPSEYLPGERLTPDGRTVRLVLRAEVVGGTGSCSNGLATMEMPMEPRDG